ncbi:MAG: exopolysaccharide biosynthesis protein [Cyanobacteria bacterium J06641_5]
MAQLSTELQRFFFEEERQPQVKLNDVLALAQERIFGFLFVLIALPSALPVPAAGYSIPFAVVILLLAAQLVLGSRRPWLPPRLLNASVKLEMAQGFAKAGIPWLKRFEAIAKPRLNFVCTSGLGQRLIGVAIALMAVSMMIPIPGTNTLPAIGIVLTGLGLVEDDGILALLGLLVCLAGATLTTLIIWFGKEAIEAAIDFVKAWLSGNTGGGAPEVPAGN